jgi:hypothetical protein
MAMTGHKAPMTRRRIYGDGMRPAAPGVIAHPGRPQSRSVQVSRIRFLK